MVNDFISERRAELSRNGVGDIIPELRAASSEIGKRGDGPIPRAGNNRERDPRRWSVKAVWVWVQVQQSMDEVQQSMDEDHIASSWYLLRSLIIAANSLARGMGTSWEQLDCRVTQDGGRRADRCEKIAACRAVRVRRRITQR